MPAVPSSEEAPKTPPPDSCAAASTVFPPVPPNFALSAEMTTALPVLLYAPAIPPPLAVGEVTFSLSNCVPPEMLSILADPVSEEAPKMPPPKS